VTRILFVDDEANILAALGRMLRDQRGHWQMSFAEGAAAALEQLRASPFDVVVSDMRMPGTDGAALLAQVREESPATARIILSGHSEPEASLRAAAVAHRFLNKPCDAAALKEAITATCALQAMLHDRTLQAAVAELQQLPSVPQLYAELTRAVEHPDVSLQAVAEIIDRDMAMSAKVLQLTNSAFFALPKRVTNVMAAVTTLGTATLRSLVLSIEVFEAYEQVPGLAGFSLDVLQHHALMTAAVARRIAPDQRTADDASMAGLLHDIGILVLATRLPDRLTEMLRRAGDSPIADVERALGIHHAQLGAYLLGLWGLPAVVVEAVACHHTRSSAASPQLDLAAIVHLANVLAHEHRTGSDGGEQVDSLDPSYVTALGVADRLPAWRAIAAEAAGAAAV
jgi:putative nucleotidyltransferase with HDIG domain